MAVSGSGRRRCNGRAVAIDLLAIARAHELIKKPAVMRAVAMGAYELGGDALRRILHRERRFLVIVAV
jgi:hypothetical protein